MDSHFDGWLEFTLYSELERAYAVPAVPALARYRKLGRPAVRGIRRAGKLGLALAMMVVLGTAGAEAAGYGPLHVGSSGLYIKVGAPATPNPPVTQPMPTAAPSVRATETPEREVGPSARETASPSESPEREVSPSSTSESETPSGTTTAASPRPSDE